MRGEALPATAADISREGPQSGPGATLGVAAHVGVLLAATALLLTRRPDAFLNPQFWAEDGAFWFAQAYEQGAWAPFGIPHSGYLLTIARIAAAIAVAFPLRYAPAIFNLVALVVQLAPLSVLLSARASVLASLPVRLVLGLLYVCIPNSFEIHMNVTNAQWHLALLFLLVVVLPASESRAWRAFDWLVIVTAGLSGPFSFVMTPIAWVLHRKGRLSVARASVVTLCAAVQLAAMLFLGGHVREQGPLGVSVGAFSKVVGGQIVVGSLLGQKALAFLNLHPHPARYVFFALTLGALLASALVLLRGSLEHKAFLAFAALILAATLASSTGNVGAPAWPSLGYPGMGGRYWFIPMLACLVTLVWLAGSRNSLFLRAPAIVLLLLFPIGAVLDWRYRPFEDFRWGEHAAVVESSPPGTRVTVPINPSGWGVILTAHPDR